MLKVRIGEYEPLMISAVMGGIPSDGEYELMDASGLYPPPADIVTKQRVNRVGSVFQKANVQERQVILTLAVDDRNKIIGMLCPALRVWLGIYGEVAYPVNVTPPPVGDLAYYTYGYIESIEFGFFEMRQICTIAVKCPDSRLVLADGEIEARFTHNTDYDHAYIPSPCEATEIAIKLVASSGSDLVISKIEYGTGRAGQNEVILNQTLTIPAGQALELGRFEDAEYKPVFLLDGVSILPQLRSSFKIPVIPRWRGGDVYIYIASGSIDAAQSKAVAYRYTYSI